MISALVSGRLVSQPVAGTTKTGKPFIRCTVACDVGGEVDVMVGLFVMEPESINLLEKARKGDSLAAQGSVQMNSYVGKDGAERHGLSLSFAKVLTVRQPKRERE